VPDPYRSIAVRGEIDERLLAELTPEILRLQHEERSPITVIIDSRGGSVAVAEQLERLLRAKDIDGGDPCTLITVVAGRAMSAAADLLSTGDYAYAYPGSIVHCHGIRQPWDRDITAETASSIAEWLRSGNDQFAFTLAIRCAERFFLRFVSLRSEFPSIRENGRKDQHNEGAAELDDLMCFVIALTDRVSPRSSELIVKAGKRYGRYQSLLNYVLCNRDKRPTARLAETEASILRAILDFELFSHALDPEWTLGDRGLGEIQDDFRLLMSRLSPSRYDPLNGLCKTWAPYVLSDSDQQVLQALPPDRREAERIQLAEKTIGPAWFFLVALCHCLQEGENELTAADAYWIGIVDEVYGEPSLWGSRQLAEAAVNASSDSTYSETP
jgi:hypothetical protein